MESREQALAVVEAVSDIVEVAKGGVGYIEAIGLVQTILSVAPVLKAVIEADKAGRVKFGTELFDALTGEDATALEFTKDRVPGLTLAEEEQILDGLKNVIEGIILRDPEAAA